MKTKQTSYPVSELAPLSGQQIARLKEVAALPEDTIDYTDIPVLTDEQLRNAVRGRFYKPVKRRITARVDADELEWLRSQGKGYQSRINAILRKEMLTSLPAEVKPP